MKKIKVVCLEGVYSDELDKLLYTFADELPWQEVTEEFFTDLNDSIKNRWILGKANPFSHGTSVVILEELSPFSVNLKNFVKDVQEAKAARKEKEEAAAKLREEKNKKKKAAAAKATEKEQKELWEELNKKFGTLNE